LGSLLQGLEYAAAKEAKAIRFNFIPGKRLLNILAELSQELNADDMRRSSLQLSKWPPPVMAGNIKCRFSRQILDVRFEDRRAPGIQPVRNRAGLTGGIETGVFIK